jgi:hypothetical protein
MFCLSRRANVVESFDDGKLFFRIFMRLREKSFCPLAGHGKPANLRWARPFYIEAEWRAAPGGAESGDWRVSHGALPGWRRWVTSAHLSYKE